MKRVLGVIVEYNPFHYGHLFHLKSAQKIVNPEYTVAVMSGNFCQRGEPSIIEKFARAEIALKNGIDIVFELPFVYSIQDAGGFALGSVWSLHKTGVVTDIVFGSESSSLEMIEKCAKTLVEQPEEFQVIIKKYLKEGYSYPNARKYALKEYFGEEYEKLFKSNDILGIEYVKTLIELKSTIKPNVIKRVGAMYTDEELKGKFSSATAIRKAIKEWVDIAEYVPETTYEILKREFSLGRGPVFWEDLNFILSVFRLYKREDFEKIHSFNEGLDKRFYDATKEAGTLQEFTEIVKAKRFTFSRIRRAILHAFFKMEKDMVEKANKLGPQYLRVLGFTEKGRELLSEMKKVSKVPIVPTASLYKNILKEYDKQIKSGELRWNIDPELYLWMFEKEFQASDVYTTLFKDKNQRKAGLDFRMPVII